MDWHGPIKPEQREGLLQAWQGLKATVEALPPVGLYTVASVTYRRYCTCRHGVSATLLLCAALWHKPVGQVRPQVCRTMSTAVSVISSFWSYVRLRPFRRSPCWHRSTCHHRLLAFCIVTGSIGKIGSLDTSSIWCLCAGAWCRLKLRMRRLCCRDRTLGALWLGCYCGHPAPTTGVHYRSA